MEITKMLTLSTAHIEESTAKLLANEEQSLVLYPKAEYGWFVYIGDQEELEEKLENLPKELASIIQFTLKQGCEWLCLDRDGEILEELPQFDW